MDDDAHAADDDGGGDGNGDRRVLSCLIASKQCYSHALCTWPLCRPCLSTFNVCPNMKRFDSFNLLTALPCCSDRPFYEQNLHLSAQIRLPELDFPRFPMAAWDWEAERLDSGRLDLGCCWLSFTNKHRSHHIPLMCGAC